MPGEGLTEGLPDGTELGETVIEGRGQCVVCLVGAEARPVIAGFDAGIFEEVDLDAVLLG